MPWMRVNGDQDLVPHRKSHVPAGRQTVSPAGRTLLPGPVASLVTAVTQISLLSLRVGSKVGGYAIAGARETTLTSLELTRAAVEAVLTRAGRDVSDRRNGELGKAEAEGLLEKSVSALHSTIATVSFFASTSFYLSAASLQSASALSIHGLSTLNAILGSTESSRAVAAIITLIKDEFNKPEVGNRGEVVGYIDLVIGTVGFALLQRWGRRKTERDFRENGGDEIIWDTVIDDRGFRADVVWTKKSASLDLGSTPSEAVLVGHPVPFKSPAGDGENETLERSPGRESAMLSLSTNNNQTQLSDDEIREHIVKQLPHGAHAVITSETVTAKKIKVEIYDAAIPDISAPPGTLMVDEQIHDDNSVSGSHSQPLPNQTVVFRSALKRCSSAEIEPLEKLQLTTGHLTHPEFADMEEGVIMGGCSPMSHDMQPLDPASKKIPISSTAAHAYTKEEESFPTFMVIPPISSAGPIANQKKPRIPPLPSFNNDDSPRKQFDRSSFSRIIGKGNANSGDKLDKSELVTKSSRNLSLSLLSASIKDSISPSAHEARPWMQSDTAPSSHLTGSIPTKLNQASLHKAFPQSSLKRYHDPSDEHENSVYTSPRPSSRQNFYAVHEKRRDSIVSETESFSAHSFDSRPGSPTFSRALARTTRGISRTRSDKDIAMWGVEDGRPVSSESKLNLRSTSFLPSNLYSVTTKSQDETIILASREPLHYKSIFDDDKTLAGLADDGKIPGMFPNAHLVRNVRRFARFASASYGSNFLRVMGLSAANGSASVADEMQNLDIHREHSSFSNHTGLPTHAILLSSFEDPEGAGGSTGPFPSVILPLVHFVSVDHDSHAVVLTCRGTLGFEDVLTDMTCDYDDLTWRGKSFKVHKGIHASARRLLSGKGSRVIATVKAALEDYPKYGLVLCGHSLGGAVASLFAILVSEPSTVEASGAFFATAVLPKLLSHSGHQGPISTMSDATLPAGRPIHVYAYGTPATMSPSLRLATRSLITTVVNSADIVPSLSLGVLHDFRSVALNLKTDTTGALAALKTRVWDRIRHAVQSAFYVDSGPPPPGNLAGDGIGEDTWAWAALKTLRAGMTSDKLVPPGEVFVVETMRVFDRQRDNATLPSAAAAPPDSSGSERVFRSLGRPATRVQMKLIRDVETRFGELRFGSHMFSDHSPGRYEASLAALERGITEH